MRKIILFIAIYLLFSGVCPADVFYLVDDTSYEGVIQSWNDDDAKVMYRDVKDGKLYFVRYLNLKKVVLDNGQVYLFKAGRRIPLQMEPPKDEKPASMAITEATATKIKTTPLLKSGTSLTPPPKGLWFRFRKSLTQ